MTKAKCEFCEDDYVYFKKDITLSYDDEEELNLCIEHDELGFTCIQINFCPFCGRDLNDSNINHQSYLCGVMTQMLYISNINFLQQTCNFFKISLDNC